MSYHIDDFDEAKTWPRPPKPFKYVSKKRELRIILRPSDRTIDAQRRVITIQGLRAEFKNGEFFTDDPLTIAALRNHPLRNAEFSCADDDGTYVESKGKVVKEVPKIKFSPGSQAMTTGANSTMNKTADDVIKEMLDSKEQAENVESQVTVVKTEPTLTRDEVVKIIDDRLADAITKIAGIVSEAEAQKAAAKKPKIFTCKLCKKPFTNGYAVHLHMKEEHSDIAREDSSHQE